ncbi:MAG: PAS-domain containing protein, partial [Aestuariivirgaceae bacterium]
MKHDSKMGRQPAGSGTTGFAIFDDNDRLLETNAALLNLDRAELEKLKGQSSHHVLKIVLQNLASIDGKPVRQTKAFLKRLMDRWAAHDGAPIEAETIDGRWRLLTSHPRPYGGTALISVDMTEPKQAQLKLHENEEIFRCITESHPLPVWMADEETGEILYESVEASKILGRDWNPDVPQFIGEHYDDLQDREVVKRELNEHGILRDYIVRFKKADGTRIWISANVRRGTFHGRKALIAGIVDVTARKEREDQIRFMLESHPLPVAMNEVESGRLILESPAAAQMFGRDPNAGTPAYTTDHYVNAGDRARLIAELRRHGSVDDFEALWKRKDGSQFWARINVRLVEYDGREVMLAGVLDITEQKERENELTRARELMADAIDSISEGFALFDEDARLVMCNSTYAEMNKVAADILEPGVRWEQLLHVSAHRGEYPTAIGREVEWLAERHSDRTEYNQNHEFQHADGRWYSVSIHQTRLGGFVVTRTDITGRKQNEVAQREADEVVRQVVEACPAALEMRRIEDGEFLYRSPAAVALLGARADLTATYVDPQDQADLHKYLEKHGEVFDRRMQLTNAAGRPFWASVSARYIDFRGDLVIVSTISDLTERVEIEQGFKRASELLTDAIESLSEGFALFGADNKLIMCNERYKQMNNAMADLLEPGLGWDEFLDAGVERRQFLDAIGREEQWVKERKTRVQRHDTAYEYQQSDGRWYSGLSSATREGGFVLTRVDITERRQMEEAQREADAVVRQVIDDCPVALEMRSLETGECIFRSPGAADLLGERQHPVESYVDSDDRKPSLRMLEEDGEIRNRRLQLKRPDDTPFWASVSARVAEFRDQKVVVSTISDLSEQVLIEQERNRAHELLADAIESLAEGFALYDSDCSLVMCNARYRQMNATITDLLKPGANWHELLEAGLDRGRLVETTGSEESSIEDPVDGNSERNRAYQFRHIDGRWYSAQSSPTREGGFVVTRMDITKRKQMEA